MNELIKTIRSEKCSSLAHVSICSSSSSSSTSSSSWGSVSHQSFSSLFLIKHTIPQIPQESLDCLHNTCPYIPMAWNLYNNKPQWLQGTPTLPLKFYWNYLLEALQCLARLLEKNCKSWIKFYCKWRCKMIYCDVIIRESKLNTTCT